MASTTLGQSTKLHAFIECQGFGGALDSRGLGRREATCFVTVLLASPSPHDIDYSDYSSTFRDGGSHRVLWDTEDLSLLENEYDGLVVKKLNVGFQPGSWPKWLGLLLPPVEVDGSLQEISVPIFVRSTQ